jgi:VWFA-related protein
MHMHCLQRAVAVGLLPFILLADRGTVGPRSRESSLTPERWNVQTTIVLTNAVVLDRGNRFVADLQTDQFRLSVDGIRQQIRYFSVEQTPVSFVLLLDISGSMKKHLQYAKDALTGFLSTAGSDDEFCLVTVNDDVNGECEFTTNIEHVKAQAIRSTANGATALRDGIVVGLSRLKHARHSRTAMVILSDGRDTASRYKWKEALRIAQESTTSIFAISIGLKFEDDVHTLWLRDISETTGGRYIQVDNPKKVPQVLSWLECRTQYVFGFAPAGIQKGSNIHKIRLELTDGAARKDYKLYWRRSYFSEE